MKNGAFHVRCNSSLIFWSTSSISVLVSPFLTFYTHLSLKKSIDKWRDYTGFCKYYHCAEQQHHNDDGQQPISFSEFCKLPKFWNKRLFRHDDPSNIFLKIDLWAGPARALTPSMMNSCGPVSAAAVCRLWPPLSNPQAWSQDKKLKWE